MDIRSSHFWTFTILLTALVSWLPAAQGAVPQSVGYQGHLTTAAGSPINGPTVVTFSIYSVDTGGAALWTDTLTLGVTNGRAAASLGRPENPLPPGLFEAPLYLGVTVETDPEMMPRLAFTSTGFALKAGDADTLQGQAASALDQSAHVGDTANPHGVTPAQLGAATASDLSAHEADASSHHARYTDSEAVSAVAASDGSGSGLDADRLDGLDSSDFVSSSSSTVSVFNGSSGLRGSLMIHSDAGALELLGPNNNRNVWLTWSDATNLGFVSVHDSAGNYGATMRVNAEALGNEVGELNVFGPSGQRNVWLTYHGSSYDHGYVGVGDSAGAIKARMYVGAADTGHLEVADDNGNTRGQMSTTASNLGDLQLFGPNGERNVWLSNHGSSFDHGFVGVGDSTGATKAVMYVGAADSGQLDLANQSGDVLGQMSVTANNLGDLQLRGPNSELNVWLSNHGSSFDHGFVGVGDSTGEIKAVMHVDAAGNGHISTNTLDADTINTDTLTIVGGSDIAEPFEVTAESTVLPGMVVAIDPARPGKLRVATDVYDPTVAGIVSGAGGVNPGITLSQDGTLASGDHPVALTGRVYCYVDADAAGPIAPGDMLTTSSTPGHAMKATDRSRAFGATIGKAMTSLDAGTGLVLVLVSLQ